MKPASHWKRHTASLLKFTGLCIPSGVGLGSQKIPRRPWDHLPYCFCTCVSKVEETGRNKSADAQAVVWRRHALAPTCRSDLPSLDPCSAAPARLVFPSVNNSTLRSTFRDEAVNWPRNEGGGICTERRRRRRCVNLRLIKRREPGKLKTRGN